MVQTDGGNCVTSPANAVSNEWLVLGWVTIISALVGTLPCYLNHSSRKFNVQP